MGAASLTSYLRRAGYTRSPQNPVGYFSESNNSIEIHPGSGSYFQPQAVRVLLNGEKIQKLVDPSNGAALDAYSLEPELITNLVGDDREKRRLVQFNEIPRVLVNAVVSAEDKRFFDHMGFDPLRVTKAAYVDLKEGRKEQGASTITMQLARGIWLEPQKRWKRKATELMISMILEQQLTKDQIFAYHANQVYL